MENELEEFFGKDGSIGVILVIGEDGARYKDIVPNVVVSHDTVAKRLGEARDIGLITSDAESLGPNGNNVLTKPGEICYTGMVELGLDEAHETYVDAVKKYNKLSDEYPSQTSNKREWFNWYLESNTHKTNPLRHTKGPTQSPDALQEALEQDSIEPLLETDNEYIDVLLWEFMFYPPKPDLEDVKGLNSFFEMKYRNKQYLSERNP